VSPKLFVLFGQQLKGNEMDDRPEQETISVDRLINLISRAHDMGKKLDAQIARGTGGREISLSLTELERARHWARDAKELLQGDKEA
jgi:hypothetical protein